MNPASLLAALNIAKSSLGANDSVYPVLANFCFMGDIVYAYNDQTAIILEEKTGLNCALHGETLLGILSVAGTDDISVKVSDGAAHFKLKSGWVKVPALDEKQFMFIFPDEEPILSIPFTDDIATALERCLLSVSPDSVRAEFTGVSVHIVQNGISFFSSDNVTAMQFVPSGKFMSRKQLSVVIPQSACSQMLKLYKGKCTLKIGQKFGVFESEEVTLVTKLIQANIDLLQNVFKTHAVNHHFFPLPDELGREVAKADVLLGREAVKECVLTFTATQVVVTAAGVLGSMEATIKLPGKSLPGTVRIEPAHVLRAIQYADQFTVNDRASLVLRQSAGGMTYLVSSKAVNAPPKTSAKPPSNPNELDLEDDIPF